MKPDNYNYEVLIVDDDLNAAQDYVELVNTLIPQLRKQKKQNSQ